MAVAAAVLSGTLSGPVAVAESKDKLSLPQLKQPKAVPVKPVRAGGTERPDAAAEHPWRAPKVTWPAAGSVEMDLAAGTASKSLGLGGAHAPAIGSGSPQAGKFPVAVYGAPGKAAGSAAKMKVTVAARDVARKAGVDGVLLSVGRADGARQPASAKIEVDYNSFRAAYGGDYAARLHLVELPSCSLTTPDRPECRTQKSLETRNDIPSGKLTAEVTTPGAPVLEVKATGLWATPTAAAASASTVLAATAGASGASGDYKATPLQPSGSWNAGGSTGAFTWSYNVAIPPVPGGLAPKISLDYNSQSIDGRTAASNSQASWIGDGWSWEPGFIERKYKPCNDDKTGGTNSAKVGDQCWFNDNATLSLNGKSTELVFEQGKGWHPASDSGEKVEKLTGATNGDNDGEHWKITTTDGIQYFFGLNRLPGWRDASTPTTNSTWTVPVYGNQAGEPCYNASFASAWCQQAWRWQLDYVVAPGGSAMAYYWKTETNNYGRNVSQTTGKGTVTPYIRSGWLDRIDYGLRAESVYSAKAMGQVSFNAAERCLTNCGTFDEGNAKNWPDSPYDQFCKDGSTECKNQFSPTFWSRMRLAGINTRILTGGTYKDVDSWALQQDFPPSGDGISTPLWLKSITRTAKAGDAPDIVLPPITFAGEQKPNRVDKTGDGLAPFIRLRMYQVTTESGGTTAVTYSQPDCTVDALPAADASNTKRCYPVKWAFEGETAKLDWFNTYVVDKVVEGDNIAGSPDKVTSYSYLGGAAWDKSTDEFTKSEDRVNSVARGYERVQVRVGAADESRSLTEMRYFRGLDGKEVKDGTGAVAIDRPEFAGRPRESATYDGDDTEKLVGATSSTPWRSDVVAKRVRPGLPDLVSYKTGVEKTATRTTVTGGIRTTELTRHYDGYGMVDWESQSGDTTTTGDETCTTNSYARNTTSWILDKVSRVETVAVPCGSTVNRPTDVVSDNRTYFDNGALGTVPGSGLLTKTETINAKGDGYEVLSSVPSSCGAAKDQLCYDVYGRQLAIADQYGKLTTIGLTPSAGEVATTMVVTNPKGHAASSELDPLRGLTTKVTDPNGKVTTTSYDALGRTSKVWLPNWPAATNPDKPSRVFEYTIRNDGPNVVTSKSLTHDYKYSVNHAIQDGLLRPRQTQTESPDLTGRLISETFYDTKGQPWRSSGTYYADGAPDAQLVSGPESAYPASADTLYDGAGRPTAVISKRFGVETKRATTSYTGDSTTVIPPQGGTSKTTVVDALGRTVELKQYTDAGRMTSQSIRYEYNRLGRLARVTDPSGAQWTYTYDVRGSQIEASDPDKGTTKTTYDSAGKVTDVIDARGNTLHTDYDELGRPTAVKQGGTVLTSNVYDTVAKGKPAKSTRYIDGQPYESEVLLYDHLYQPLQTQVTIPATPDTGALAGTYKWTNTYNITGQLLTTKQPAMGDLPAETIGSTYKSVSGLLNTSGVGSSRLVSAMTYDHYGRATRQELGASGQRVFTSTEYDDHTGNVTRAYTDREVAPQRIDDTRYTLDPSGNLTTIATASGQDADRTTDTQCVNLDALRRIVDAWTNKGESCAPTPSETVVGGPDAYWTTYTYDSVGNRKTETKHKTASEPIPDTVRTYAAPTAGKHDLPKITQTGTEARDETFTYDASGNTKTRKIGTEETQYLEWDAEGHLKSLNQGTSSNSFAYDTAGQRMLRKDSTGTTLYLPGGNELKLDKSGKVTGTRYYGTVAMRTAGKLSFTLADHHGTGTTQISVDAAQSVTRRKTGVFGEERGTQPTDWSGEKGFVGGTKDTDSGFTHLGAREYDPLIGRFISVDPIMDLSSSQQLHGYIYSSNNPFSLSDPTGEIETDCLNGNCGGHYNPRDDNLAGTDPHRPHGMYGGYNSRPETYATFKPTVNDVAWLDRSNKPLRLPKNASPKFLKEYRKQLDNEFKFLVNNERGTIWTAQTTALLNACQETDCPDLRYYLVLNLLAKLENGELAPYDIPGGSAGGIRIRDGGKNRPAKGGGCQCFLAGTRVVMADGTSKVIEEVEAGDEVLASDPRSGEVGGRKVSRLIATEDDKHFNKLSLVTGAGVEELTATQEHPFWSPSENAWINAADLKPGMSLATDVGGTAIVAGNESYTGHAKTYNLTIEDLHTYYVLADDTPVLVHNSSCPAGVGRELIDGQAQFHIIHGDKTGGGHKWPGQAGKTVFPSSWGTDQILDAVADVATSPSSKWDWVKGPQGSTFTKKGTASRVAITGTYDGVDIKVIYEPASNRIITGYPYK
ncbi:polymorphic toxin-type HINT domain-containing protein [Streptomyces racemochromogenes]|uniref:polymorphic toxin-type HINT domain-containing protein n=1 Tax=Streptomyces racemochromogenes TaxID=67353 RepID=UPI0031EABB93